MEQETINFALVGTGMVAEFHRKAIAVNEKDGARLAAVVHYNPERFERISAKFGVPCVSLDAALDRSDVDAVILCTPSGQHAEQAVKAARAGKHVLVEKPIALSLEDADRMIEECEKAGVKLGVVFQRRVEPLFRKVHEAITEEVLGDLTLGVVTLPYYRGQAYYDSAAWRGTWALDGGGILMNQGIHILDLLLWYMGEPVDVSAFAGTRFRDIEVEDVASAVVRFESGAYATIAATTTAEPGFPHRLELYGTQGAIQIEGEGIIRWTLADPAKAKVEPSISTGSGGAGSGGDPGAIALTGHIGIIRDFVDAIRENRPPLVDGLEGRRSLSLIRSIYQSAGIGS